MRLRPSLIFLSGSVAMLLLAAVQDPKTPAPSPQQIEEMMQRAKQFTEPGEKHAALDRFLGKWTTATRFVMGGQRTPPEAGEVEFAWLMAGRWLQSKGKGTLMQRPTENSMLLGYDNMKQSFVATMVGTMDTAMLHSEGDLTQDGKALILYGTLDEYLTGEHDKMVKYVFRFASPDSMVLEVHDLAIGETGTMVVEVTYAKKG